MGEQATTILATLLIVVVLVFGMVFLPRFLMRRAVRRVISQFRQRGATSPDKATPLAALGLAPKSALDRMFKVRDYRPMAARLLGQANVIRFTEEGTAYLSEEELENSPVKKFAGME